jgi:hypothetical protein
MEQTEVLQERMRKLKSLAVFSALAITLMPLNSLQAQDQKLSVKEGTDVKLKFAQELSSKTANEGDPVNFVVDDDVKVGDVIVIRSGTKAVGTVTNAKRAGMMGKGGELNVRLDHLKASDIKVRLRGTKGKEGDSKAGQSIALTVLFGPIGLIKHGKEIVVKEGTPLAAYVDDDVLLPPAK